MCDETSEDVRQILKRFPRTGPAEYRMNDFLRGTYPKGGKTDDIRVYRRIREEARVCVIEGSVGGERRTLCLKHAE